MKFTKRFVMYALVLTMLISMFFTACSSNNPTTIPQDEVTSALTNPGGLATQDATKTSMFRTYWVENKTVQADAQKNLEAAKKGAKDTGTKAVRDLFKVYEDAEGKFIISFDHKVYLDEDGRVPANMYDTLRLEGTGERVYVFPVESTANSVMAAVQNFNDLTGGTSLGYADRDKIGHYFGDNKDANTSGMNIRINGVPAMVGDSLIYTEEGYVKLNELLAVGGAYGYIDDFQITNKTATAAVLAAGHEFTVEFQFDADYNITKALADGREVTFEQRPDYVVTMPGDVWVSVATLANALGWDFDVYTGDKTLNIITDTKDTFVKERCFSAENVEHNSSEIPSFTILEGSITVPEKPVGYDSPEYNSAPQKVKIVSGPNAGQTIDWPSNDAWATMSTAERQKYIEMRDPDLYATAQRAGESDAEYRARLATYRTQEQLDEIDALLK